jgi:hypothetical protein
MDGTYELPTVYCGDVHKEHSARELYKLWPLLGCCIVSMHLSHFVPHLSISSVSPEVTTTTNGADTIHCPFMKLVTTLDCR